jgi:hypothetical protein
MPFAVAYTLRPRTIFGNGSFASFWGRQLPNGGDGKAPPSSLGAKATVRGEIGRRGAKGWVVFPDKAELPPQ